MGPVQAGPVRRPCPRDGRAVSGGFQAALNYAATVERFDAPKLGRTDRLPRKRIRFLSRDQEERLLASYAPHVSPIAEALCFQGLRVGEALRLVWGHVDCGGNSLKTGEPRAVTRPAPEAWRPVPPVTFHSCSEGCEVCQYRCFPSNLSEFGPTSPHAPEIGNPPLGLPISTGHVAR
jgi:integrase